MKETGEGAAAAGPANLITDKNALDESHVW